MPGSGKTTLAEEVARASGLAVTDTDDLVSQATGMPAHDYLFAHGQEAFDRAEDEALRDALARRGIVVVGGGATDREENVAAISALRATGVPVVVTQADPAALVARLGLNAPRPVGMGAPRRWIREWSEQRHAVWASFDPLLVSTSNPAGPDIAPVLEALASRGFSPRCARD
nr:shikimate kinase [Nanchangia anserum]